MFSYRFKYLISTFKYPYHRAKAFDFGTAKRRRVSLYRDSNAFALIFIKMILTVADR